MADLRIEQTATGINLAAYEGATQVDLTVDGAAGDTWHVVGTAGEPAFQSGWTQNTGSNDTPVAFRRLLSGLVVLRGYTKPGSNGTAAFTLPVGYRPTVDVRGFIVYQGGQTPQVGVANVMATGEVVFWRGGFASIGTEFGLAGISFYAD